MICSYILGSHPKSSLQFLEGVLHSKLYIYTCISIIKYSISSINSNKKTPFPPPFRQIGCNQKDPFFSFLRFDRRNWTGTLLWWFLFSRVMGHLWKLNLRGGWNQKVDVAADLRPKSCWKKGPMVMFSKISVFQLFLLEWSSLRHILGYLKSFLHWYIYIYLYTHIYMCAFFWEEVCKFQIF